MKRCWKCKTEKKLNDFYKNRCQVDGYEGMCKKCKTFYHKEKGYDNWEYKITKWNGRGDYGVYKITNISTDEVYIGKGWLKEREYDHFYKLKNKNHDNPYFQKSFNLNPKDWKFEVLENCNIDKGLIVERDYIIKQYLESKDKLLNTKLNLRFG